MISFSSLNHGVPRQTSRKNWRNRSSHSGKFRSILAAASMVAFCAAAPADALPLVPQVQIGNVIVPLANGVNPPGPLYDETRPTTWTFAEQKNPAIGFGNPASWSTSGGTLAFTPSFDGAGAFEGARTTLTGIGAVPFRIFVDRNPAVGSAGFNGSISFRVSGFGPILPDANGKIKGGGALAGTVTRADVLAQLGGNTVTVSSSPVALVFCQFDLPRNVLAVAGNCEAEKVAAPIDILTAQLQFSFKDVVGAGALPNGSGLALPASIDGVVGTAPAFTPMPEPAGLAFFVLGLAGLGLLTKRRGAPGSKVCDEETRA